MGGHGEYGHNISSLVARKIPKYLKTFDYINDTEQAIKSTVDKIVETLRKSNINTTFSGTTLCFSLIVNDCVYTANIGDSRVIMVSKSDQDIDNDNQTLFSSNALSIDHKLEIAEEKERILSSGGRVA